MSVSTITNRATNPKVAAAATGYAAVAGTGGTATGARNTGTGYTGAAGFFRVAWTAATTALSGGASYTQTGLAANTQYSHLLMVRSSKAQTVRLSAQYQTSAAANVGAAVNGAVVTLAANTWTAVLVEAATSGAAVDRVVLTAAATTGGTLWANGDTLDVGFVTIVTGPKAAAPFDGSYTNAASTMYAWTGAADASTSTATTYSPVIAVVAKPDFAPCPRVEITLTDLTPTANTVTVWRTADGRRQAVRGFRKRSIISADFIVDYEAPLGRPVSYDVEVLDGINAQAAVPQTITALNATAGCIQDPLVPGGAVPVHGDVDANGEAYLRGQALKALEYAADMSIVQILGSPDPVALMGQRMAAGGVDMSMSTRAAQAAADMRRLLQSSPLLLVRPLPEWASALPGLCYLAAGTPTELPVTEAWGGSLIRWELKGDLVAAPTMNVLVPLWTYGDVKALWGTYQQAQTALSGKTYLDVLKSPAGT